MDAIDYLLKPTAYDEFLHAAQKAQKYFAQKKEQEEPKTLKDHFFVNSDGKFVRVNLNEIDYIESMSEYVKICLCNKTQIVTLNRLKNIEDILPKESFMRIHRSFIVNAKNITTIERNRIVFYGNIYIPVSDPYKADFKKFIDNNFLE